MLFAWINIIVERMLPAFAGPSVLAFISQAYLTVVAAVRKKSIFTHYAHQNFDVMNPMH